MEIEKTFNMNKEEIKLKKENILIPICVGNKFFLNKVKITENVYQYINWALENTKEKVLILIVDKIQLSNWIVRNKNNSLGTNFRRLTKDGGEIKLNFEELIKNLPKNNQEKIKVIGWEEYDKKDPFCSGTTRAIYQKFKNNDKFRKEVLEAVKKSIMDRKFKEKEYWRLCDYLLDEFSVAYHGVEIDGIYYGLYPYPDVDTALIFIEDIKKGLKFKTFSERLYPKKINVAILK